MSEFKKIEISNVYFDIHNPRSKYASSTELPDDIFDKHYQENIIPDLLRNAEGQYTVENLRDSIKSCGTINNPIQVKTVDGKYVCVEGNTRLLIYKKLYSSADSEEEKEKWSKIPAQVFENISANEEAQLKLTAHVVGARDWKPYSRAKYIQELKNTTSLDWQSITQVVGGRQSTMMKLYEAVVRFDEHYVPLTNERSDMKFSHYVESQSDVIKGALEDHGFSEDHFAKWVEANKFRMAINVRKLPKILANPDAKDAFLKGDYDDAVPYITFSTGEATTLSAASVPALIEHLSEEVRKMDKQYFEDNAEIILELENLMETIETAFDSIED
tara:strand:+ start:422 stop:1411 length:990 start_codon:yes stop_codon:yes gene_type:complete